MSMPKPRSDTRVALWMLCDGALRQPKSNKDDFRDISFLNLCRMLDWMHHCGGYPIDIDSKDDYIEETNAIVLRVLKEKNLDAGELREKMIWLTEPSPFTIENSDLEAIEDFVRTLSNELKKSVKGL
jgi:hypothetical protein